MQFTELSALNFSQLIASHTQFHAHTLTIDAVESLFICFFFLVCLCLTDAVIADEGRHYSHILISERNFTRMERSCFLHHHRRRCFVTEWYPVLMNVEHAAVVSTQQAHPSSLSSASVHRQSLDERMAKKKTRILWVQRRIPHLSACFARNAHTIDMYYIT